MEVTGAESGIAGQERTQKGIVRAPDRTQTKDPRMALGAVETTKEETHEATDNEVGSAAMK